MNDVLSHHGVKGQKWGVRRYQKPDGSLTLAGKKRALKMQNRYTEFSKNKKYRDKDGKLTYAGRKKALKMKEQYSDLTGKTLRGFTSGKSSTSSKNTKPKTKSLSEMSNKEIQDKIERIRLENTLKSLTPKQVSRGEKFVNGLKDAAVSIVKDKGTKIVGDYVEKQLKNKLGLNDNRSQSEALQRLARDYTNRMTIDRGQQHFGEGRYANQNNNSQNNQRRTSNTNSTRNDEPIDAEWREVDPDEERRRRLLN